MRSFTTAAGETVYLSTTGDRGSKGPFLAAFDDADGTDRYGWFCANCESVDTAMDAMGRIECNVCGNRRKPTEWDAAHE